MHRTRKTVMLCLLIVAGLALFSCAGPRQVTTADESRLLRYQPRLGVGGWVVPPNTKVELRAEHDGWFAVQWGERSGWLTEDGFRVDADNLRNRLNAESSDFDLAPSPNRPIPQFTESERRTMREGFASGLLRPEIVEYTMADVGADSTRTWFVLIGAHVDVEGRVEEMRVVRSEGVALDEASLQAAARCRFTPGSVDGVPTAMWTPLPFRTDL